MSDYTLTVEKREVTPTLYSCRDMGVTYSTRDGARPILEGIGFDVCEGEFVSVLGPSGTGKTTLLRALGGLVRPTPGSCVEYGGQPVTAPPDGVVIVFQNYAASLLPWRTVAKNVALGLERTMPRRERAERAAEALELVGLAHRADDYPWRLSGGMQQRVQIARALAMRPKVLLMDEPFGALDAMTKAQLQDEMARLHEVLGTTVIFVTHDIEEAVYLSDRVVILRDSPARVDREIVIDLPRPRDQVSTKELPRYLELRHAIHAAIGGEAAGVL